MGEPNPKEAWAYAQSICRSVEASDSPKLVDAMDELCEVLGSSPRCLESPRIVPLLDELQIRLDECSLGGGRGRACDPLFRAVAAVEEACRGAP